MGSTFRSERDDIMYGLNVFNQLILFISFTYIFIEQTKAKTDSIASCEMKTKTNSAQNTNRYGIIALIINR